MNIDEIEKEADSMAPGDAMDFLIAELNKRLKVWAEYNHMTRPLRRARAALAKAQRNST